jgi:hypothetical protein
VAALATLVIGFLWYSLLFDRPWMVLMSYDPDDRAKLGEMQKGAGPDVCPHHGWPACWRRPCREKSSRLRPVNTALYGMKIGLAVWSGFVTTVQLTSKQPARLYPINTGYQLVCNLATP